MAEISKEAVKVLTKKHWKSNTIYITRKKGRKMLYARTHMGGESCSFGEWSLQEPDEGVLIKMLHFIADQYVYLNVEKYYEKNEKELFHAIAFDDKYAFGKVIIKNDGNVRIKKFGRRKLEAEFYIEFDSLMIMLGWNYTIPPNAYFKITREGQTLGEVLAATHEPSPRAINFLLLASGIAGASYCKTKLLQWEPHLLAAGFDYEEEDSNAVPVVSLLPDLHKARIKSMKRIEGVIEGGNCFDNRHSWFMIWKRNDPFQSETNKGIGKVVKGMELVKNMKTGDVISECGVYIKI